MGAAAGQTHSTTPSGARTPAAPGGAGTPSSAAPSADAPTATPSASAAAPPGGAVDPATGASHPVVDDVYPQYGDPATDVLHYGLDLHWDPAAKMLTGTATLTIRAAQPTDRFVLDLAGTMTSDSVQVDGAAAAAAHAGDRLTVPVGKQLPAGGTASVVIAYHGTPQLVPPPMTRPDIPGVGAQVTASGGVWAQQEPYGAFTWFPCNDQPSDKALYDVTITAPDGWAGVTGGTFQGRTEANGSGVYKWHQPDPVSTYLVAFSVDRFQEETATGPHGLPLTYWYLPADAAAAHQLIAAVPEVITFLEQRYGPYPFPTAGVLFRPDRVGMETQTMITLSTRLPVDDLLHEFAHQWFGDAVTPTTWSGLWLNEGFAMYSQFMWDVAHAAGGAGTLDDFMTTHVLPVDQSLRQQDGPPGHFKPTHFASTNVYYCPALMLNGLHDALGDKAFYQLLNDWAHKNKGTNQDRAAFIAFVKADTGKDFSAYINAWLDSPTTPTIKADGSGGTTV
ncbi:M1 family metallopeptidase [Catenulispora yoronensis]|uniref:Aminopeptidase N n=2 Tax=Catenulispora yoronensis TaxID=450799 RepID=A0ABN2TQ14_9ACTN